MALAKALKPLGQLKRLDLNDNTLGEDVGVQLGEALKGKTLLESINLGDTSTESWLCVCLCVRV